MGRVRALLPSQWLREGTAAPHGRDDLPWRLWATVQGTQIPLTQDNLNPVPVLSPQSV